MSALALLLFLACTSPDRSRSAAYKQQHAKDVSSVSPELAEALRDAFDVQRKRAASTEAAVSAVVAERTGRQRRQLTTIWAHAARWSVAFGAVAPGREKRKEASHTYGR
jgi:hypothetical protein